jgi:hypothetical protein
MLEDIMAKSKQGESSQYDVLFSVDKEGYYTFSRDLRESLKKELWEGEAPDIDLSYGEMTVLWGDNCFEATAEELFLAQEGHLFHTGDFEGKDGWGRPKKYSGARIPLRIPEWVRVAFLFLSEEEWQYGMKEVVNGRGELATELRDQQAEWDKELKYFNALSVKGEWEPVEVLTETDTYTGRSFGCTSHSANYSTSKVLVTMLKHAPSGFITSEGVSGYYATQEDQLESDLEKEAFQSFYRLEKIFKDLADTCERWNKAMPESMGVEIPVLPEKP